MHCVCDIGAGACGMGGRGGVCVYFLGGDAARPLPTEAATCVLSVSTNKRIVYGWAGTNNAICWEPAHHSATASNGWQTRQKRVMAAAQEKISRCISGLSPAGSSAPPARAAARASAGPPLRPLTIPLTALTVVQ